MIDDKNYYLAKHNFALNDTIIYSINCENTNEIFESKINYVNSDTFTIDDFNFDKIFIQERIISNFKSVNYNELLMLCICCIQDLYKREP